MRQGNAAFLSKLGWRVISEPESLWSRVLRRKYGEGKCTLDMFKHKLGAFKAWRGIVDNIDVLRQGVSMAIGNGRATSFWFDKWAQTRL